MGLFARMRRGRSDVARRRDSAADGTIWFGSLRYVVSMRDLCSLPLPGSFSESFFAGVCVQNLPTECVARLS